ncbi:hypothetical protein JKF63_06197 [Porcisia hertigi]|uniref:Uncharacterized protein n=1 Tax=Porcisia hertigi TaxID=2761500 RepID=A0A836INE8_9TRYP|nr:hypothetical protein JKF63_06197 [Porcisia hertigi]
MSNFCIQDNLPSFWTSSANAIPVTAEVICELSPVQRSPPHDAKVRVEERLLRCGAVYQERLTEAQHRKSISEAAAVEALMQPPSPTHRRCLFVPTPSFHESAEVARRHRAERRFALLAERATPHTRRPSILPASREMATAQRKRNDWLQLSVGDLLVERHRSVERHLEAKRQEEMARFSFKPAITARACAIRSSRTVVQRLFNGAKDAATDKIALGDITNLSTMGNPEPKKSPSATYHRLYEDAMTRRAHEQTREKLAQVRSGNEFCPRIDTVSGLIASHRGDTTQDRLLRPKRVSDAVCHLSPEETFVPRTNKSSRPQRTSLFARAEMWQRRRNQRLHHASMERDEAEMRECTFHPGTRSGLRTWSQSRLHKASGGSTSQLVSILTSAEEFLSHIDAETLTPPTGRGSSAPRLSGFSELPSAIPADILTVLEEVESTSEALRVPPKENLDLDLSRRFIP